MKIGYVAAVAATMVVLAASAKAEDREASAEAAVAAFAEELAELQREFPDAERHGVLAPAERVDLWQRVVEQARNMRERWRDNPYIEVEGFSISLGWPLGIDVAFRFKE